MHVTYMCMYTHTRVWQHRTVQPHLHVDPSSFPNYVAIIVYNVPNCSIIPRAKPHLVVMQLCMIISCYYIPHMHAQGAKWSVIVNCHYKKSHKISTTGLISISLTHACTKMYSTCMWSTCACAWMHMSGWPDIHCTSRWFMLERTSPSLNC